MQLQVLRPAPEDLSATLTQNFCLNGKLTKHFKRGEEVNDDDLAVSSGFTTSSRSTVGTPVPSSVVLLLSSPKLPKWRINLGASQIDEEENLTLDPGWSSLELASQAIDRDALGDPTNDGPSLQDQIDVLLNLVKEQQQKVKENEIKMELLAPSKAPASGPSESHPPEGQLGTPEVAREWDSPPAADGK